ncbi:hypothetical protein CI102_9694 [Trichoderma harzianum]|nr:hypothetical protein CI102_9694 [Trichoderma harzianum]
MTCRHRPTAIACSAYKSDNLLSMMHRPTSIGYYRHRALLPCNRYDNHLHRASTGFIGQGSRSCFSRPVKTRTGIQYVRWPNKVHTRVSPPLWQSFCGFPSAALSIPRCHPPIKGFPASREAPCRIPSTTHATAAPSLGVGVSSSSRALKMEPATPGQR